jgi:hypothetical protein
MKQNTTTDKHFLSNTQHFVGQPFIAGDSKSLLQWNFGIKRN